MTAEAAGALFWVQEICKSMIADFVKFKGYRCFQNEWVGFDLIKPVNVIIGRNNTGKSHLIDFVESLCKPTIGGSKWSFQCSSVLDEALLRQIYNQNYSDGELRGNHWFDHGRHFVGKRVTWEIDENSQIKNIGFEQAFNIHSLYGKAFPEEQFSSLQPILTRPTHFLSGRVFRRLLADRDITQESPENQLALATNGRGATNIVRRYIVTSNPKYPRELIQHELRNALNIIFGNDGCFNEIQVKVHDEAMDGAQTAFWEIYLGENKKGLIPLSNSGSGLKTVFLVLLNLLVVPVIAKKKKSEYVFAFEELENNLHPALLRRLLQFIEAYAVSEKAVIFLTTHSSAALDLFGISGNAQIIHVTHDGQAACARSVSAHFDHLSVISELGAKPSDLLQANGMIWVEGPSDCIYINRWIDLFTGGRLKEGRDYQCAFYGGSLLARTQFASPEEAEAELVNLFRVNSNIVVVCDGDRKTQGARVKDRVRRIRAEVLKIPRAHIWVTAAREIENYLPGNVLAKATGRDSLPDPTQYESFFPKKGAKSHSYIESRLKRKGFDKVELANLCVSSMDLAVMGSRFDWQEQMKKIVDRVDSWNR